MASFSPLSIEIIFEFSINYPVRLLCRLKYLARDDLDLEGLLEVLLIDDADLLSGIDGTELVHNIFLELLGLGAQKLWI